jgi:hypothetical protein
MKQLIENWRGFLSEQKDQYIVLIPGGFKPPHRGHKSMIDQYISHPEVEKIIILIGSSKRVSSDGSISIGLEKTLKILDLYNITNDPKVEVKTASIRTSSKGKEYENPFYDAVEFVINANPEEYKNNILTIGYPDKESNRGSIFLKAVNKSQATVGLPPIVPSADHISATRLRDAISSKDEEIIKESLPDPSMYEEFMNIIFST